MRIDINRLVTVKSFADKFYVTASYIYKLVKEGKMSLVTIDGVKFVDIKEYPVIPVVNRRK